jgi:hypothetical protein
MFALRSSNTLEIYACRWEPMICAGMFSLLLQLGKSYRPPGQQPAVGVPGYEQGRCTLRLWWWRANQSQVSALRTLGACMEDKRLQRKHKLRNVKNGRLGLRSSLSRAARPPGTAARDKAGEARLASITILPVRCAYRVQTRAIDLLI